MGTWGTALYSDDLAADLRDEFTDAAGDGLEAVAIVDRLVQQNASSVADSEESATFWLVAADMGWRLGRLDPRARLEALMVIESGRDLERWEEPRSRAMRAAILLRLRDQLNTPPPPPRRVPRRVRHTTDWTVGEVFALRLRSGRLTLLRVVGYHEDRGGRFARCELLNWKGDAVPPAADIDRLQVRSARHDYPSEFILPGPRKKADQARLARTGIVSAPTPRRAGMLVFLWPHLDRLLVDCFGMD